MSAHPAGPRRPLHGPLTPRHSVDSPAEHPQGGGLTFVGQRGQDQGHGGLLTLSSSSGRGSSGSWAVATSWTCTGRRRRRGRRPERRRLARPGRRPFRCPAAPQARSSPAPPLLPGVLRPLDVEPQGSWAVGGRGLPWGAAQRCFPWQELRQKRAQKSGEAEHGLPKESPETRAPGQPRPPQEPSLTPGVTARQPLKANNTGEWLSVHPGPGRPRSGKELPLHHHALALIPWPCGRSRPLAWVHGGTHTTSAPGPLGCAVGLEVLSP